LRAASSVSTAVMAASPTCNLASATTQKCRSLPIPGHGRVTFQGGWPVAAPARSGIPARQDYELHRRLRMYNTIAAISSPYPAYCAALLAPRGWLLASARAAPATRPMRCPVYHRLARPGSETNTRLVARPSRMRPPSDDGGHQAEGVRPVYVSPTAWIAWICPVAGRQSRRVTSVHGDTRWDADAGLPGISPELPRRTPRCRRGPSAASRYVSLLTLGGNCNAGCRGPPGGGTVGATPNSARDATTRRRSSALLEDTLSALGDDCHAPRSRRARAPSALTKEDRAARRLWPRSAPRTPPRLGSRAAIHAGTCCAQ